MKTFQIALYPGDGIGPEVIGQAVRVLERVQELDGGFTLRFERFDWGCDYYDRHGVVAPENYLEILRPFDAIFFGAVGYPSRLADHISLGPLVRLRQSFDQYACVRPAKLMRGVRSLLADAGTIDMVIVRENSEGEYLSSGGRLKVGTPDEVALESAIHTCRGIERILRFGFDLAVNRRKRVTLITKSNAMRYGYVLWDEVFDRVANDYPAIATDRQHIDAASMNFVRQPGEFDVVVASNLFGDILSDLSGAITGSLGLNPSANLNPQRRYPSLFEPVHGSAPDIVGKGVANPIGAVLSAAMMLDWLDLTPAADAINKAVHGALGEGCATPDLGGTLSTSQMADAVIGWLPGDQAR